MQINSLTRNEYNGQNADALAHYKAANGFKTNEWLTFLQAKQIGRQVKKGAHGCKILKLINDPQDRDKRFMRTYTVFNLDQTEPVLVAA
jgi:antirestriction protein ArdC